MFRKYFKRLFHRSYEKKAGFNRHVCYFSAEYRAIAVEDIINIHKYLMRKNNII